MEKLVIKGIKKEYEVIINNNELLKIEDYLNSYNKIAIFVDEIFYSLYENLNIFKNNKIKLIKKIKAENDKNFLNYQKGLESLLNKKFNKNDLVLAIGGGATLDLASFIAATYKRGINLIFVPTTLLSMSDACIGSKNGINSNKIKNAFGTFYDPSLVLIDPNILKTCDTKQIQSGLGEIIKASLIADTDLFNYLSNNNNYDYEYLILSCLKIKKKFIEIDPYDKKERHALNFGHTYGHAIEKAYNLPHGIAVAYGMLYVLEEPIKGKVQELLAKIGINLDLLATFDLKKLKTKIKNDKKVINKEIELVKVKEIGTYQIEKIKYE